MSTRLPSRCLRWLIVPLAALLSLALVLGAVAQPDFGNPVPGQRVYDRTGVLTAEQISSLEARVAAVEAAGAPTFVYLQPRDTDYDATVQDARDLMDDWDVQSATDVRDGIVIFFNLDPDDLAHGDYAVIAGKTLIDGNIPQRELDRITDLMQPLLEDGDIAGAIGVALDTIERSLREGPPPPPPPSRIERFSDDITSGVFSIINVIAAAIMAVAVWLVVASFPKRHTGNLPEVAATYPPDRLQPGLAGALVTGSVSDANISATILDLASRGALAIEPQDKKKIQIHLLDESLVQPGYEQAIWQAFAEQADAEGIVPDKQIGQSRKQWGTIRGMIKSEMINRGWFDPRATSKALPFYVAAAGLLVLMVAALIFLAISANAWAIAAVALLGAASVITFSAGIYIPSTTPESDQIAAPWRGYQRYLKSSGKNPQADIDLDIAVPYAVALGASNALNKRLKSASEEGFLPIWLGSTNSSATYTAGFYPYWMAFNSSVTPSSTASSSSGASAGSGASGGSF